MEKPVLQIGREEIEQAIFSGLDGKRFYLVVSPDGMDYRVSTAEEGWPEDWYATEIPSIDPPGSWLARLDAWNFLSCLGLQELTKKLMEIEGLTEVQVIERLAPEVWMEFRALEVACMAEDFLSCINGDAAWGCKRVGDRLVIVRSPARFEWRK